MKALSLALLAALALCACTPTPSPVAAPPSEQLTALRDPATQLRLAQRLEAQGNPEAALEIYEQLLRAQPDLLPALEGSARLLTQAGLAPAALMRLETASKLAPQRSDLPLQQAALMNSLEQPEAALAKLDVAEARGAQLADVEAERGLAFDLLGQTRRAQLAYARAMADAPQNQQLTQRLATSLALSQDYGAALALLQQQANDPAGAAAVRGTLATVYALSGQTEAAMEIAGAAMPAEAAQARQPFFKALAGLPARDRAVAAHLGRLPMRLAGDAPPPPTSDPAGPRVALAPPAADAPLADAPAPAMTEPLFTPPPVAQDGQYWVQLASVEAVSTGIAGWPQLQTRSAGLLAGYAPAMEAVMVGSGMRYRIMVGPFASETHADALAGALRAQGMAPSIRQSPSNPQRFAAGAP